MADDHYMPFFVGDFLASTATWTGPERGLYIQMLALEWSSGPLPADPDRLARVLGYSKSEFELIWPQVRSKFRNGDGKLTNDRLEVHRTKNAELAARRHDKAVHAANSKHAKSKLQASSEQVSGIAPSMPSTPIRSNLDLLRSNKSTSARKAAPAWFEEFKSVYPPRAGSQEWGKALRAANARIAQGFTPDQFIAGAKRYHGFNAAIGKLGTIFVKQAASFLGPDKHFLEPWAVPPTKAEMRQGENIDAAREWLEGSDEPK